LKVLLEDFFELSIIESTDYPMRVEPIRLNHLVLEVLASFYEAFHQRQLEPSVLLPEDEIKIMADPSAVKRVIENLLSNAIRHSSGDVTIELTRSQSLVRLTVSNEAVQ